MGALKIKRKAASNPWIRLSNAKMIEKFTQPDCKVCEGKGLVGEDPRYAVCSCVTLAFRRLGPQLETEGKLRERSQRISGRDVKWFEYREYGSVPNDNQCEQPISSDS